SSGTISPQRPTGPRCRVMQRSRPSAVVLESLETRCLLNATSHFGLRHPLPPELALGVHVQGGPAQVLHVPIHAPAQPHATRASITQRVQPFGIHAGTTTKVLVGETHRTQRTNSPLKSGSTGKGTRLTTSIMPIMVTQVIPRKGRATQRSRAIKIPVKTVKAI